MSRIRVAIVGGGIGGLALARALAARGGDKFAVTVYERDDGASGRGQGYVLGINGDGLRALRECACDNVLAIVDEPAMSAFTITDERLNVLVSMPTRVMGGGGGLVDRWQFHDALELGLTIERGRKLERVAIDAASQEATLTFADGSAATADLVVGADGVSSAVRAFVCPQLARHDTGVSSLGASLPMERVPAALKQLLAVSQNALLRVMGPGACSWLVLRAGDPATGGQRLLWVLNHLVSHEGEFASDATPAETLAFARGKAERAHADLVGLIDATTPADLLGAPSHIMSMHADDVTQADFLGAHTGGRVALLGDAAHSMTTHRGVGANTALQDAQDLALALLAISNVSEISRAVQAYTKVMKPRGAKNVGASLNMTMSLHDPRSNAKLRNNAMWLAGGLMSAYAWVAIKLGFA